MIGLPNISLRFSLKLLDYCCISWGSWTSVSEDKLIQFQKRAARI